MIEYLRSFFIFLVYFVFFRRCMQNGKQFLNTNLNRPEFCNSSGSGFKSTRYPCVCRPSCHNTRGTHHNLLQNRNSRGPGILYSVTFSTYVSDPVRSLVPPSRISYLDVVGIHYKIHYTYIHGDGTEKSFFRRMGWDQ